RETWCERNQGENASCVLRGADPSLSLRMTRRSSTCHPTAVDDQYMTVDVVGSVRSQKDDSAGEIRWITPTTGRNACRDLLGANRIVLQSLRVVGAEIARCDRVHLDVRCTPFVRERLCQASNGVLARGVGWHRDAATE